MASTPEPYDLRSNIKGTPGSQGTLFQVKDKGLLNPAQRWPKGYTPERLGAVREALKDTPISGGGPIRRATPAEQATGRYAFHPQTEARVHDTLARSTMPTENMRGLSAIHNRPFESAGTSHLASYFPGERSIGIRMFHEDRDQTEAHLVHEMGHHVSNITGEGKAATDTHAGMPGVEDFDYQRYRAATDKAGEISKGVEEAYADNHATEHYRPHPAARKRGVSGPESIGATYDTRFPPSMLKERFPGYDLERPKKNPNMGPQFHQGELF